MADEHVNIIVDAVDKASGVLGGIGNAIGNIAKLAAGVAVAGIGAMTAAVVGGTKAFMDWGDTLDRAGDITGLAANDAAALAVAVKGVGGDFDNISNQLAFFGKGLETAKGKLGPTGVALKSLGIDAYETGKTITVTGKAMGATQAAKLGDDLARATARLHDMQAAMAKAKNPTESATFALADQQAKVAKLSGALGKAGTVITSTLTEKGPLKSSIQLLKDVSDKLADMPDGLEKSELMMQLFGKSGKEMSDVINSIAKGGLDEAAKKAKLFGLAIGDDGVSAAVKAKNSFAELELMGQGLAVTLGTQLMPVIMPLIQQFLLWAQGAMPAVRDGIVQIGNVIGPIIDAFGDFVGSLLAGESVALDSSDEFSRLAELLTTLGIPDDVAVGISDTVGVIVQVFGDLFNRIGDGKTSITDLVSDFVSGILQILGMGEEGAAGVGSFVAGIVGALASVVAWVSTNWPLISATITSTFNQVSAVVTPIIQGIIAAISSVVNYVITNWPQIQATIVGVFNQIVAVVGPILQSIVAVVQVILATMSTFWQAHGAEIVTFISTTFNTIVSIVTAIGNVIGAVWAGIAKFFEENQAGLMAAVELAWGTIRAVVEVALGLIRGIINAVLAVIKGDWSGAWASIKAALIGVWESITTWFAGVPSQMVEMGRLAIEGLVKGLEKAADQVVNALTKIINDGINAAKKFLGIQSPSTVFAGIGENMMRGLANGIANYGNLPAVQLQGVVGGITGPSVNMSTAASPTTGATVGGGFAGIVQVFIGDEQIEAPVTRILYKGLAHG